MVAFAKVMVLAELEVVCLVLLQLIANNPMRISAITENRFFMSECFVGKCQKPYQTIFSSLALVAGNHVALPFLPISSGNQIAS